MIKILETDAFIDNENVEKILLKFKVLQNNLISLFAINLSEKLSRLKIKKTAEKIDRKMNTSIFLFLIKLPNVPNTKNIDGKEQISIKCCALLLLIFPSKNNVSTYKDEVGYPLKILHKIKLNSYPFNLRKNMEGFCIK